MLEMKIQLSATEELIAAMKNLAAALNGENLKPTAKAGASAASAPIAQPATPMAPVNPTPAQVTQPTATPATMPAIAETTVTPATMPAIAETTAAPAVPTSAPQYTLDMIATAGSALIDAGKMDQLMGLLGKFGVASLTELAPESYGAVANELRALGAAI
nr:MAG TPA: hypothetical protein [Caudoviricetes sp.]